MALLACLEDEGERKCVAKYSFSSNGKQSCMHLCSSNTLRKVQNPRIIHNVFVQGLQNAEPFYFIQCCILPKPFYNYQFSLKVRKCLLITCTISFRTSFNVCSIHVGMDMCLSGVFEKSLICAFSSFITSFQRGDKDLNIGGGTFFKESIYSSTHLFPQLVFLSISLSDTMQFPKYHP